MEPTSVHTAPAISNTFDVTAQTDVVIFSLRLGCNIPKKVATSHKAPATIYAGTKIAHTKTSEDLTEDVALHTSFAAARIEATTSHMFRAHPTRRLQ